MKRNFILLILLLAFAHSFAISDKVRIGLMTSPGISWAKPFGNELQKGKPRFGINYGVVVEYWFARNYGLSTGLSGAFDGSNIRGRRVFQHTDTSGVVISSVNEKYGFHYLEIPLYLKLKTNDIKSSKFCVWGQLGITLNITVSARATYDNPIYTAGNVDTLMIDKENILKKSNDVARVIPNFSSGFIDVRLGAGFGFEYRFDERTSLLVGLFYHNGFVNNIIDHDAKKEPIVMRSMNLRVGVLF